MWLISREKKRKPLLYNKYIFLWINLQIFGITAQCWTVGGLDTGGSDSVACSFLQSYSDEESRSTNEKQNKQTDFPHCDANIFFFFLDASEKEEVNLKAQS